jgi:hypothetical protein
MSKRSISDSTSLGDRFIPRRSFIDADVAFQTLMSSSRPNFDTSMSHERYKQQIQRCLLGQSHRLPQALNVASLSSESVSRRTTEMQQIFQRSESLRSISQK